MAVATSRGQSFRRQNRVNLRFKIPYFTKWGQNLMVCGSDLLFGRWNIKQGVWMTPHHEGEHLVWQALVSVPERFKLEFKYYVVDEKLNVIRSESGDPRSLQVPGGLPDGAVVDVLDLWQDGSSPDVLLSRGAFQKVIFSAGAEGRPQQNDIAHELSQAINWEALRAQEEVLVRFRIGCASSHKGQIFVTGSPAALGNSSPEHAVPLLPTGGANWEVDVAIPRADFPVRYRYLLKDADAKVKLEEGDDLELEYDNYARNPSVMLIVSDGHFRATPWRGGGVAVPMFSLRSGADVGSGEFLDLKLLVDFAVKCGLRLVQLLPVNDTSVHKMFWDSYPYSSLSVFALHPLYLNLQALSDSIPSEIQAKIDEAKRSLDQQQVDYEGTMKAKLEIAKELFALEKKRALSSERFRAFFEDNQEWLKPYAAFCFLRDLFGTADHSQWGALSAFSPKKLEAIVSPDTDHYDAIAFWYYLQFHLFVQLKEAADYARKHRVVLKGDLPIGVGRHSVDTWQFPTLFRMSASTGAPPDMFDANGQNWGFPTYNWEEMAKDNYAWWRMRCKQLEKFFSAYRIDHILGFFRIWELPDHAVTGLMGRFRPSIPISAEELEAEGVWDFNRLCEPYLRAHILQERLGAKWSEIATRFMDEYQNLCFRFKPEYNTENKIRAALESPEDAPASLQAEAADTEKKLFDLLREVVLMRDAEDPRKFYPRFNMDQTSNFKELDDHCKAVLSRLYNDYYFVRQETLWRENGLRTLPVLMQASDMLTCGEDLGLVPACVPPVLSELGLLGLRIQRMPTGPGIEFNNPADYEYLTVCAPSCHDTSTLRAWWEGDPHMRQRFFREALGFSEDAPDTCTPEVARAICQQHVESPSVWAIFPLQDLLALSASYSQRPAAEETINDPTNPKHYWRFRVHVPMETMLEDEPFIGTIQDILLSGGRAVPEDFPEGALLEKERAPSQQQQQQQPNHVADGVAGLGIQE